MPDSIPAGVIVMWRGVVNDIPEGWSLCDGTEYTPDLRSRFVLGAGSTYDPGVKGGEREVGLSKDNLPTHSHRYSNFGAVSDDWRGGGEASPGNSTGGLRGDQITSEEGGGKNFSIMPPYYSLCFIMKSGVF